MGDGDKTAAEGRHPHHDVGEGEVGQQLAVGDEHVQPVDVLRTIAALGKNEITER